MCAYDGIWVSGLHAGAIPERARFDPFIPIALQRQAGIHDADAAALVDQAQHNLPRSAAAVVSSLSVRPRMPQTWNSPDRRCWRRMRRGPTPRLTPAPSCRGSSARRDRSSGMATKRGLHGRWSGRCRQARGRSNCRVAARSGPTPSCGWARNPSRRPHRASRLASAGACCIGPWSCCGADWVVHAAWKPRAPPNRCRSRLPRACHRPPAKYCRHPTLTQWMRPTHRSRMPPDCWRCGVPPSARADPGSAVAG